MEEIKRIHARDLCEVVPGHEFFSIDEVLTLSDVQQFARLSGDSSRVHFSHEAAREFGFEGPTVHEALIWAKVSGVIGAALPEGVTFQSVSFYVHNQIEYPCRLRIVLKMKNFGSQRALIDVIVSSVENDQGSWKYKKIVGTALFSVFLQRYW